jgi:hypothetical protein
MLVETSAKSNVVVYATAVKVKENQPQETVFSIEEMAGEFAQ